MTIKAVIRESLIGIMYVVCFPITLCCLLIRMAIAIGGASWEISGEMIDNLRDSK